MSAIEQSDLDLGEDVGELLPTGTVTLLLADVEASTQLWECQPEVMTAAIAELNRIVNVVIADHSGFRPVEQGEGDSFVAAFAKASDAVAAALDIQRADLAPITLRIGVHTGEVQLRDEGNYSGSTINKTARLRDLAHGGQIVMSAVTEELVEDRLPAGTWLTDLGRHPLRDLPRPIRVAQLCHPDLRNDFPPLRVVEAVANQNLPTQLTTFVGRSGQIDDVRRILAGNRLVTLTGAGGAGKTRLAIEVARLMADELPDGVWYADLAPVTQPSVVPLTLARVFGLPDQPGRSITETLLRFLSDRRLLVVMDNCEHLLDATAGLVAEMLASCSGATILATSREPIMVAGEVNWQVPSLSLDDEATDLFADRGRRARPGFAVTEANIETVTEICRRLDGMPLAIELAAARVRALSVDEIADSLHDRFRLLTGGSRTAVRRQQTLRASVDWSHALLTDPERILFRRLAAFMGGFDLDAAQAVAGASDVERFQVLDQLSLLVDKSLVGADDARGRTRYRLLETIRQYAQEKLGESGESGEVRTRHRDYYAARVADLEAPPEGKYDDLIGQAETEIDNLRAAFDWSIESNSTTAALEVASSLLPLWLSRGRLQEGMTWLDAALAKAPQTEDVASLRALADRRLMLMWTGAFSEDEAARTLEIARRLGDPRLLTTALVGCGMSAYSDLEAGRPYFGEAVAIARESGDTSRLSLVLGIQANVIGACGDPVATVTAAREGLAVAREIGDRFTAQQCVSLVGIGQTYQGDLANGVQQLRQAVAEAAKTGDRMTLVQGGAILAYALAHRGDPDSARVAAETVMTHARGLGEFFECTAQVMLIFASMVAGDAQAAWEASEALRQLIDFAPAVAGMYLGRCADAALAYGDYASARHWADQSAATTRGWHRSAALVTRARCAIAEGHLEQAERDAHEALAIAADVGAHLFVPDLLECHGRLAGANGNVREAARLFGASAAARQRMESVRFKVFDAEVDTWIANLRDAMDRGDFEKAWAEGAALSTEEAIAYAQRGRGARKRPSTGWDSLTPTELDVVRLVAEGIANKDIATRLFVSPRTVQSHLRHVYNKLGTTSRVQLAQQAARHF